MNRFRSRRVCDALIVASVLLQTTINFDSAFAQANLDAVSYDWQRNRPRHFQLDYAETVDGNESRTQGVLNFTVKQRNVTENFQGKPLTTPTDTPSTSSAFLVNKEGYLLTCEHCIRHAKRVQVTLNGQVCRAQVVAADPAHDLAILKINLSVLEKAFPNGAPALGLSTNQAVKLAQDVRAIGFPLSDLLGSSVKVTRGGIAGFVGGITDDPAGPKLYQIDAAVNPGNSGGPLVDEFGNIVGIVNAKLSSDDVDKVGFAVPVRFASEFLTNNQVKFESNKGSVPLRGPVLAERVAPAVAFVEAVSDSKQSDFLTIEVNGQINVAGEEQIIDSRVIISAAGEIIDSEDAPRLGAMLCSVATLPFIKLPEVRLKTWQDKQLLSFQPPRRRRDPFGMFDSFGAGHPFRHGAPFGGGLPPEMGDAWDLHDEMFGRGRRNEASLYLIAQHYHAKPGTHADRIQITENSKLQPLTEDRDQANITLDQTYESTWTIDSAKNQLLTRSAQGAMKLFEGEAEPTSIPFELTLKRTSAPKRSAAAKAIKKRKKKATPAPTPRPNEPLQLSAQQLEDFLDRGSRLDRATQLKYLNRLARWKQEEQANDVVNALQSLAADKDRSIRTSAINALLHWSPKAATESVIRELESANAFSKRSWMIKLGKTNSVAAAAKLSRLLSDTKTRSTAARLLEQMGPVAEPAIVDFILDHFQANDPATFDSPTTEQALLQSIKLLTKTITPDSVQQLRGFQDHAMPTKVQRALDRLLTPR